LGLNFARNCALANATGQIIAYIDDDVVVDRRWMLGLRRAWAREPIAGAFTGQTLPLELETDAQVMVERMGGFRKGFEPRVFGQSLSGDPLYPVTTIFGNGCNMAFNVDLMRSLGGFDEAIDAGAYLPGGGDLDALFRVVRSGRPLVYEPRMLVRHQHRRDLKGLRRQVRWSWGAGCMAFLIKIRDEDPEMSTKAAAFIRWWLNDLLKRLVKMRSTPEQPWGMALQELVGAAWACTGLYRRSRRRSGRIRRLHDAR
jgi:GT2 family glycosyltransferase